MSLINTFLYNEETYRQLKELHFGKNWPVVYLLENSKELYVGESTNVSARAKQHFENTDRQRMNNIHLITDNEYNISAAKDIESLLIEYFSGEGTWKLQNKNGGMQKHDYYDKQKYQSKFRLIWEELYAKKFVRQTLDEIRNKDVFKFSPYKSLTEDQMIVVMGLREQIIRKARSTTIVNGGPGTGKTVLAIYLYKYLKEHQETKDLEIGIVIPMTSLRQTVANVFGQIDGLKKSDVLGPNQVVQKEYDLLIVDEAHRLKKRKNLTGYGTFDETNRKLGLDKEKGTELDWIIKSSRHQILFYDPQQSIRPTDVDHADFAELNTDRFELQSQLRVEAGEGFVELVTDFWENNESDDIQITDSYDFRLFKDITNFRESILRRNKEVGLARIVSGYSWKWVSKKSDNPDIVIGEEEFIWNTTAKDWVNTPSSVHEVGCIHTIQGYDLNYIGLIIGREIDYDFNKKEFVINLDLYFDAKGKAGTSPEEVKGYILNIYKTMMTRGVKGIYLYIVNDDLRKYLEDYFGVLLS